MSSEIEVVELCPLKSATLLWRPQDEAHALTVICKATYELREGVMSLAEAQDDVNERDLHAENNPELGLYSASDLAPHKTRADVTVVGKAYAPPGELARALVARVKVGPVDKRVEIHAERYMRADGRVRDTKFFSKMALGYERAPGGPGSDNPVGVDLTAGPGGDGRIALPNLQAAGETPRLGRALTPVGFGPFPASWPSRRRLAAGHADWLEGDWCEVPVPASFDWRFFNVAPRDQQLEVIDPSEVLCLEHLHPEEPKLEAKLPGIEPRVFIERADGAGRLPMKGDTLWIDTNRMRVTLCWRGTVALAHPHETPRVLIAMARPGAEVRWEAVWQMAEAKRRAAEEAEALFDDEPTHIKRPARGKPQTTAPVPLAASVDGTPAWLPTAPQSAPSSGVPSSRPESQRAAGPLVLEIALATREAAMLQKLASALGYEAVEAVRHAIREAYDARFGSDE